MGYGFSFPAFLTRFNMIRVIRDSWTMLLIADINIELNKIGMHIFAKPRIESANVSIKLIIANQYIDTSKSK